MGGLCSSPIETMLRDLQHHCDEQTEIIETMIEVEAEDKTHIRSLKKDIQVLDIYDNLSLLGGKQDPYIRLHILFFS